MIPEKKSLRISLKQRRLELTSAEQVLKSRIIVDKLINYERWEQISTLHYFEPLKELMEPDINPFITFIQDTYPSIRLYTPRYISNEWQLIAVNGGGEVNSFDVIIVPMLGFDDRLNRIGYGGGYYDKLLALQPNARKIGIAFELGHTPKIPIENHDIPLDKIITEDNIYSLSA